MNEATAPEPTAQEYQVYDYVVADFHLRLRFSKEGKNSPLLIQSFEP